MAEWVKWWKSEFFLKLIVVVLITIILSFVVSYFLSWGWIIAVSLGASGGLLIRKMVAKKIDEQ